MATIKFTPPQAKRQFNGADYILTKIDFYKADAEADKVYHEKLGRDVQLLEEDGSWLIYTKIGKV